MKFEDIDFILGLSTGWHCSNNGVVGLICEDTSSYYELAEYYDEKQQTYLHLFNKAHEEGFYELGTALLTLYLLYRTISLKGRHNTSPVFVGAINKALDAPGSKIMKHTLEFIVDSIGKHFSDDPVARTSAMIFQQFLPQRAEVKVLQGGVKSSRGAEEVSEFLIRKLGNERWTKLAKNSQDCLVSAEIQWKNSAVEFGFGIKDWSGLITTYCKAIEGELVDRLNDFFVSAEYDTYLAAKGLKRPAKSTAGWLLKELRLYNDMPQELQSLLNQSRIKLAGENDLVNRLYDIVQNYRNVSAHHDAVPMKRFAEFKEKLFQSGLLKKFIDAFVE